MCKEIAAQKAEKRRHFRTVRDGIPPAQREIDSEIIAEKVLAMIQEKRIKRVFVYLSIGSEVHTHSLIAKLLSLGVTVGVPRCDKVTHKMDAIVIQDLPTHLGNRQHGPVARDPQDWKDSHCLNPHTPSLSISGSQRKGRPLPSERWFQTAGRSF